MKVFFDKFCLKRIVFCVLLILFFIFIYDLNILYPLFADDWDYSYVYWRPEKVTSTIDVLRSQAIHYVKWGGRLITHGILQKLLSLGTFWCDLLNSLVFILYILIIYKLSNVKRCIRPELLLILFFMVWFFQVNLGQTVLWLSGSANYLWGTTIILFFVYPYYIYFLRGAINNRFLFRARANSAETCILFVILGIIAGWTNENMVVALIYIIVVFTYLVWRRENKIEKWTIYGLIGVCIGMTLMYIAPGNFVRYNLRLKALGISNPPPIDFYIENFYNWLNLCFDHLLILMILYFVLVTYFWLTTKQSDRIKIIVQSLVFFTSGLVAAGALVVAPEFSERMLFGVISFLLISIGIIYTSIEFSKFHFKYIVLFCIAIGCFFFVKTYTEGRSYLVYIRGIIDERELQISEQKARGENDIVLRTDVFAPREDLIIPRMLDLPVEADSTNWINQAFCRYYGIKSKRIIPNKQ